MSDDEGCEGNSAVIGCKAAAWTDVEFESSVESFDELFEGPEDRRFFIEILKPDNLTVLNAREFFGTLGV